MHIQDLGQKFHYGIQAEMRAFTAPRAETETAYLQSLPQNLLETATSGYVVDGAIPGRYTYLIGIDPTEQIRFTDARVTN